MTSSYELTTAGARTAYLPNALPAQFEDQERTDFRDPAYEKLRNCLSGVAAIFDRHVRQATAVRSDSQLRGLSPSDRQKRIGEALAEVSEATLKDVDGLEQIAIAAEKQAVRIEASLATLDAPSSKAGAITAEHQALPRDKQVAVIHDLSHQVGDAQASVAERATAREYLNALVAADPAIHLLDETSRKLVSKALARSKDPAKYKHARHLALASRAIREAGTRVRELISR